VLFFLEFFYFGGGVHLIDAALASKSIDVRQFVHSKGVSLVERDAIEALASSNSLCGCGVFNESKSSYVSRG
jgi:predicted peroxiredoxin